MKSIYLLALALALTLVAPALAQQDSSPGGHNTKEAVYDHLISKLMCLCGCNTTLKACPHVNCDFAIPRKREILAMLDDGAAQDEIEADMVTRFGQRILSAPPKTGFNLVGYILPFVAIVAVGILLIRIAAAWAGREKTAPAAGSAAANLPVDAALRRKMERELSEFD